MNVLVGQIACVVYMIKRKAKVFDYSLKCGPDEIPARILKECALEISSSLCSLFNTSLKAGKVPDEWKKLNATQYTRRIRERMFLIIDRYPC